MPSELTAEILKQHSVKERKALILEHASLIDATHITDDKLRQVYRLGKIISSFSKNTQIPRLAGSEFWHKISGSSVLSVLNC